MRTSRGVSCGNRGLVLQCNGPEGWLKWIPKSLNSRWVWVNTYFYTIFRGMNIHFNPAILMWTKKGVLLVLTHPQMSMRSNFGDDLGPRFQESSTWFAVMAKYGHNLGISWQNSHRISDRRRMGASHLWSPMWLQRCSQWGQCSWVPCRSFGQCSDWQVPEGTLVVLPMKIKAHRQHAVVQVPVHIRWFCVITVESCCCGPVSCFHDACTGRLLDRMLRIFGCR